MKRAILVLGIILFTAPCFAGTRQVVTTTTTPPQLMSPIGTYNDQIQMAKDLNNIEMNMYGKTYHGQSLNSRLNRLEQSAFRRTFPTSTFQQRIDNLTTYNRYPIRGYKSAIPTPTVKQSLMDRVRTNLAGVATGLTPPIGSFGYYNNGTCLPSSNPYYYNNTPYYNSSPFGNSRYYTGNTGWSYNNYGIQSGTGVHIID